MSKIKILKATAYYPDFIKDVYLSKLYDAQANYDYNHQKLMDTCSHWADFWKTNLETTGEFEVMEVVFNIESLQKKWAIEHNISITTEDWQQQIFHEQIEYFKPDVIVMQDVYKYSHYLHNLKKKTPSIKLIIGWDGILFHNANTFSDCDLILSCVQETCDYYEANGFKTHYFKFGFEPKILDKLKNNLPLHNVSFVGSLFLGEGYHQNRLKLISYISSYLDINIWAASFNYQWKLYSKHQIRRMMDFRFQLVYDIYNVAKRNRGSLFGIEMFQALHDSKIVINTHGENSPKKAANMRLFEATGVGTCLLTDWKENISDFFEPDVEVVTFKNKYEALDKIKYLLNNENERKKIAVAGQKRTLKNYSYKLRMSEIADLIKNYCI
jgi:hypothetical protein